MMKSVQFLLIVGIAVVCAKHHFSKKVLDEFEQFLDERKDEKDLLGAEVQKKEADTVAASEDVDGNGNRDTCDAVGVTCRHTTQCWPAGFKVDGKEKGPTCLCKHGWTGEGAIYVTDQSSSLPAEGRNRIYAKDCNKACHYTHDVRGAHCASDCDSGYLPSGVQPCQSDPIPCDDQCSPHSYGYCANYHNGKQFCCRGWSGQDGAYDVTQGLYMATCCNKKCHYLGNGVQNTNCDKEPEQISDCDPKCVQNHGVCDHDTGKCKCCLGWTGPHAELVEGKIHADYCDVYCPYDLSKPDKKCVNPNYVKRLREVASRVYPMAE